MVYEAVGKVVRVGKELVFPSGFKKRVIVVNTRGPKDKYDNKVEFCATKDVCSKLDAFAPGESVKVMFAIAGRDVEDKRTHEMRCFTDLKVIGIEGCGSCDIPIAPVVAPSASAAEQEQDDGMPF